MNSWHIVTCEYPPDIGGVSDYTHHVATSLEAAGDEVHVWCPGSHTRGPVAHGNLQVHDELGRMGPRDLARVDRLLSKYESPRRLLVQWVPHGFGYHSMNVWFCLWLARRAWLGDRIELMVHEPYLEFQGPFRHRVMACVHRAMTVVLLRAARHVWLSIPAWESRLRPYALGRALPMTWLPIPGCILDPAPGARLISDESHVHDRGRLIGHFGTYGPAIATLLEERLPPILDSPSTPALLLLGAGSERFRETLVTRRPDWAQRIHATGYIAPSQLGACIAMCDLFVQPYPDGISSRRTSAMTSLAQGRPIVATTGHLTETFWAETMAVSLSKVSDIDAFAAAAIALLDDDSAREALAARGQQTYQQQFSPDRVVDALRAA